MVSFLCNLNQYAVLIMIIRILLVNFKLWINNTLFRLNLSSLKNVTQPQNIVKAYLSIDARLFTTCEVISGIHL